MPPLAPPPYPTDRQTLEEVCEVEYVKAGGPGGQHRNKRETGIRLTHPPSGVVVHATERRQRTQNLELAFERLARRLERLNQPRKPRHPTRIPRAQRRRRLDSKRHRGALKAGRRSPGSDD
jgi:ribosome-associated protein